MYATAGNHLINVVHYGIVFILVFFLLPRIIFRQRRESLLEDFFANLSKMVLIIIVLGYILVPLKLFELLAFVFIFLLLIIRRYWKDIYPRLQTWIFDYADGIIQPREIIKGWILQRKQNIKEYLHKKFVNKEEKASTLLSLTVLAYAFYLRFYDAFVNAAPAMSDAYVTLAWMKYINRRILFHDGIYPQGFHIFLAVVQKLAVIDPLYVLKYTGPLNGVLITLSIYFLVSRLTKNYIYGAFGAAVYGILGNHLSVFWERQASTNSQEFAFVFVLPALYFCFLYLKNSRREDFITAAAGVVVVGLTHTLAFAMVGMGMGALIISALLTDYRGLSKGIFRLMALGIAAVVAALMPAGIGLLMGKSFHGAAAEYLVEQNLSPVIPQLSLLDWVAVLSLALLFILILINMFQQDKKKECLAYSSMFILGSGLFFLYMWGGVITHSVVVSSRSGEIWAIMTAVLLGFGWFSLSKLLPFFKRIKYLEVIIGFSLLIYIVGWIRPQPIIPYKMEHNSSVEQYLRISGILRPTEWMIISQEEGYALALGQGYHLMLAEFLTDYNPTETELTRQINGEWEVLKTPDIFLFLEKNVFRTEFENLQSMYERREKEYTLLNKWVEEYREHHNNLSVFYEDGDILIYRIHQPLSKEEIFANIWGSGGEKN